MPDVMLQSTQHDVILHGLGSDARRSSNFARYIHNVNDLNGPKWQEMHNIHLLYYKTIVDLCSVDIESYYSFTISWLKETVRWILPLRQTREHGVGCILMV